VIAVRLMGGLGNQLFQYAVGRCVSDARAARLVLDLGWFAADYPKSVHRRTFELEGLAASEARIELSESEIDRLEAPLGRRRRFLRSSPRLHVIRERNVGLFDATVLDAPDASLLVGYWQSEKYFSPIAEVLRAEITEWLAHAAPTPDGVVTADTIGIHVRRGDYVSNPEAAARHGVLEAAYYERAVAFVCSRTAARRVLVVSDDPEWARDHLAFDVPTDHLGTSTDDALTAFAVLGRCVHHVIANSSFSWWAAWFNNNPERIVVAPRRWFRDSALATSDLVPSSWHRL
jgi:hypothetical protein